MKHLLAGLCLFLVTSFTASSAFAINCVAYVKSVTGFQLSGDAWTWWDAAANRYDRGYSPAPGAVMVFGRTGQMWLGHVAVVRELLGPREILIDQANWHHERVENGTTVIDVSPGNDWSEVNVQWQGNTFGGPFPISGFVYAPGARWPAPYGLQTARATTQSVERHSTRGVLVMAGSRHSYGRAGLLRLASLPRTEAHRSGAVHHASLRMIGRPAAHAVAHQRIAEHAVKAKPLARSAHVVKARLAVSSKLAVSTKPAAKARPAVHHAAYHPQHAAAAKPAIRVAASR